MLKPLNNYVVLNQTIGEEKTTSGIILSNLSANNNQGIVESVGAQCNKEIKIGQTVVFKQNEINKINHKGIEYLILKDCDIISIIE